MCIMTMKYVSMLSRSTSFLLTYTKKSCFLRLFSSKIKTYKLSTEQYNQKFASEQTSYLSNAIEKSKSLISPDWDSILAKTLDIKGRQITHENIAATVVGFCISHKQFNLAKSFIEHLERSNKKVNFATRSKFLKLCFETWPQCDEDTIIETFNKLSNELPVIDANTAENSILALSVTSQWKLGLELKDSMKLTCTPGVSVYTALIDASFRNKNEELGWNLAREAISLNRKPKPMVYSSWLNHCKTHMPSLESAEKMLHFLSENSIIVPEETINNIKLYMEETVRPQWTGNLSTVSSSGTCQACGEPLQPISLTEKQFQKLRTKFFERVVLGRDIFARSTPEEIKAFQTFLQNSHSYGVVIDGLNVGYSAGGGGKISHHVFSSAVRSVVEQFIHQGITVMVLGRKHMLTWPRKDMDYIKRNTKLFLANDLSQDDPLLLYAALHGGRDTYFVSRDLMRGHAFKLKDAELAGLFRRWQQWRQYQATYSKATSRVHLTPPLSFLPSAQNKEKNGQSISWHIPYEEIVHDNDFILDAPHRWLCLIREEHRKTRNQKKL